MRTYEALRAVVAHLEDEGMVVYEQRVRHGLPAMGQLVAVDPSIGRARLVRVMVGKRPGSGERMFIDRRRVGVCDVIAIVDPRGGAVRLEDAVPVRKSDTGG